MPEYPRDTRPDRSDDTHRLEWRTYAGKHAVVHAPQEGSYAARRAPAELREAERSIDALEKLLDPPAGSRGERVDIYLVDPISLGIEQNGAAPAAESGLASAQALVRTVQPEAPGEPLAWPLARLLATRWFGPNAGEAGVFLDGIAGVVAARTASGPPIEEADRWVHAELEAGHSVSIFAPGTPTPHAQASSGPGTADRATDQFITTSFVAYLIEEFGQATLREFLTAYDPDRRDAASAAAYHRPLGTLEEAWLAELRRPEKHPAPFGAFVRQIVPLIRPHSRKAMELLLYMLVGLGFNLAMPLASKYLIDSVIPGRDPGVLVVFVTVLFVAYAANSAVGMRRAYVNSWVNQSILMGLQAKMFTHLQRLSHAFYAQAKVGDIMSRLSNDLVVVQGAITQLASVTIFMTLSAIGAAVALLLLSPLLGVLVLVVLPLFAFTYLALRSRLQKASYDLQRLSGEVSTATQENLSAQPTIKAFGLEEQAIGSYQGRLVSLFRASLRLVVVGSLFEASTGLAVTLGQLLVLGVGGYLIMIGNITVGTLLAFFGFLPSLFTPVAVLAGLGQTVQMASGSLERVNELLDEPAEIADLQGAADLPPLGGEIRLEGVSFSYDLDRPILQDLNLEIRAGSHVAIVGPSGSGKSTLVSLLMRFWDPDEGRVLFDDHDLKEAALQSLRGQTGIVFQDTFVFDTTLRENIAIGKAGASDAEIATAARAARLDSYIEALPAGYNTVLGERGVRMSGGQRQRLAIARALLRDPRLLILDEATSALDSQTEREILETLKELMPGRTTISITHRLSLAAVADKVFVLEAGRLVEEGTHNELVRNGGLYARLYHEQTGFAAAGLSRWVEIGIDHLRSVPLFSGLSGEALATLAAALEEENHPSGVDIVRRGEPGDKLYIISRGQVEVLAGAAHTVSTNGVAGAKESGTLTERRLAILNEGDYFGEMALLTYQVRTATVRTSMPTTLYSLSQGDFNTLLEREPGIRSAVEQTVATRRAALVGIGDGLSLSVAAAS